MANNNTTHNKTNEEELHIENSELDLEQVEDVFESEKSTHKKRGMCKSAKMHKEDREAQKAAEKLKELGW